MIVMLLLSLLPLWFGSPANVAVPVQPSVVVTFVQSPLYVTGTDASKPPAPVTFAVAVNAEPRYVYGPASNVTVVVLDTLSMTSVPVAFVAWLSALVSDATTAQCHDIAGAGYNPLYAYSWLFHS